MEHAAALLTDPNTVQRDLDNAVSQLGRLRTRAAEATPGRDYALRASEADMQRLESALDQATVDADGLPRGSALDVYLAYAAAYRDMVEARHMSVGLARLGSRRLATLRLEATNTDLVYGNTAPLPTYAELTQDLETYIESQFALSGVVPPFEGLYNRNAKDEWIKVEWDEGIYENSVMVRVSSSDFITAFDFFSGVCTLEGVHEKTGKPQFACGSYRVFSRYGEHEGDLTSDDASHVTDWWASLTDDEALALLQGTWHGLRTESHDMNITTQLRNSSKGRAGDKSVRYGSDYVNDLVGDLEVSGGLIHNPGVEYHSDLREDLDVVDVEHVVTFGGAVRCSAVTNTDFFYCGDGEEPHDIMPSCPGFRFDAQYLATDMRPAGYHDELVQNSWYLMPDTEGDQRLVWLRVFRDGKAYEHASGGIPFRTEYYRVVKYMWTR